MSRCLQGIVVAFLVVLGIGCRDGGPHSELPSLLDLPAREAFAEDPGGGEGRDLPGVPEDDHTDFSHRDEVSGGAEAVGGDQGEVACRSEADCLEWLGRPPACRTWACPAGTCVAEQEADGSPCDDGNACTRDDFCRSGQCIGAPVQCPEEPGSCIGSVCDPMRGCVEVPRTGDPCDDGDLCTEGDRCLMGLCRGQSLRCDDGDPCTEDLCGPAQGCLHPILPGHPCDDGEPCTRNDRCEEDGACRGDPDPCDDDNSCTSDSCVPGEGCSHRPLHGRSCDDGSLCTIDDHCKLGRCEGFQRVCQDGNPCTRDLCDDQFGCVALFDDGAPCDDGNPCTDRDFCWQGACQGHATGCDDGNPCTLDTCTTLSGCAHRALSDTPCEDGDACTVGDACLQGRCIPGGVADCDDENPCTMDLCDSQAGCLHERLPGATLCDDGDACTAGDRCIYGLCVGEAIPCDDQNPCTADLCDSRAGCMHLPLAGPCDDGDPCTAGDRCLDGVCHSGTNPQCLAVRRIVLAGDSWSSGFIQPLRDALDARGYEEVVVSWETTSKPGSTVAGWLSDAALMGDLFQALDREPPAGVLLFTLGGNDYLSACRNGLGNQDAWGWFLTLSRIQADLQRFVDLARAGRPLLKVVIIGYDYLNYLVMQALGFSFPGMDMAEFNLGLVELASRGRAVGEGTPNTVYAHNMGLLQHTFGDSTFGYGPGAAPRPGPAPGYNPFPGGWWTHPSPLDRIPDGVHPDYAGFRALIENTLDQGPAAFIEGRPWP